MLKIFWTASYHGKDKYQKSYDLVSRTINSQPNLEVIATEQGNYLDLIPPTVHEKLKAHPPKLHYEAIRRGILWADAVIIEISQEDFQLGHEATLAMQSKKHVLCLSVNEDFSAKINNRYFHGAKYNRTTAEEQVESFLTLARRDLLSHRFNLFLTSSQEQFLKSKGVESGEGASNYLRSLIDAARTD
jgi:hypothetical protein